MAPSSDINGEQSELAAPQSVQEKQQDRNQPRENDRKQGESDAKRSLGDAQVGWVYICMKADFIYFYVLLTEMFSCNFIFAPCFLSCSSLMIK